MQDLHDDVQGNATAQGAEPRASSQVASTHKNRDACKELPADDTVPDLVPAAHAEDIFLPCDPVVIAVDDATAQAAQPFSIAQGVRRTWWRASSRGM